MSERKIELWDLEDVELLQYDEKDEAIHGILDGETEPLPNEIVICGYARSELPSDTKSDAGWILGQLIEHLDEECGPPDEGSAITDEMKQSANDFVKKIYGLYTPWQCEIVKRETIDVRKWVNEHTDWKVKVEGNLDTCGQQCDKPCAGTCDAMNL